MLNWQKTDETQPFENRALAGNEDVYSIVVDPSSRREPFVLQVNGQVVGRYGLYFMARAAAARRAGVTK